MKIYNIYTKIKIKEYIAKILCAMTIVALPVQSYAAIPALFYTSSFEAEVGDVITFDLKVSPTVANAVYTVGATLKYDPEMLTFIGATMDKNWLSLSRVPYELTDTKNGTIQRTGGFPEGVTKATPFTKYTFKARKIGDAKVIIAEGVALDANNNDSGLQRKEITVKIGEGKTPVLKTETKAEKQIEVSLALSGTTAHFSNNDYALSAVLSLKDEKGNPLSNTENRSGSTTVYLIDKSGNSLYTHVENFSSITQNQEIQFVIPKNILAVGDYDIIGELKYQGQKSPMVVTKSIGVVAKQVEVKNIVVSKIPPYMWSIIVFLLVLVLAASATIYGLKKDRKVLKKK